MPICLLTDFGNVDCYAGVMKGVIARIAPDTPVIDLSHEIPAFDVLQGALLLFQSYRYFPEETVFVGVVDPGVGGYRRPVLIRTEKYTFVGPDNGLFSWALADQKIEKIFQLNNTNYFLKDPSHTFHGRDIFSPVAAHISRGVPLHEFGSEISNYEKLEGCFPKVVKKEIVGTIVSIDRFGNAITNLSLSSLQKFFPTLQFKAVLKKILLKDLRTHYAEGNSKKPFLVFGSSGLLEISVNQGSAAKVLKLKKGYGVTIKL